MNISPSYAVVVNDDTTQLSLLSGLVRKAGLEPRAFTRAEAALTAMSSDTDAPPALIVTDLYMPGIDGWQFCRLLRSPEYAALNRVPILVVSATFSGDHASHIAADLGAEAFLPSPVDGERFCEQVRAILSGEQVRHPLRVLIVEDNVDFCALVKDAFVNHGYQAETVFTAQAAVEAFRKTAYDVAVLDHHLPDGMGDKLLVEFRALRPDCVCLMVTGDTGPELALDWMKKGAAAYLQKPFQFNYIIELCARARRERALLRVQDLLEIRTRELRKSEEAALRNIALLRSIMESPLDIIIFALDTHYCYTMFAQAHKRTMKAIWGVDIEVGMNMLDAITNPIDREKARKNFDLALQGEHFIVIEEYGDQALLRTVYKDRYNPILGDGGVVSGLTVFVNDITERRRAEQETKNAMALLEASISQSPSGICIADAPDVTIRWANAAALSIRGETSQPLTGIKFAQHADHWQTFRPDGTLYPSEELPLSRAVLKGEITQNEEVIIRNAQGEDRWVSANAAPVRNHDGVITAGLVIFTDITERKHAEDEKSKLESELHQAKKMELVGRLAGGVAHDFNNMIQAIMGNADLALDGIPPDNPVREYIDEVQNSAHRAAEMTRQLLGFARQQTIMPKVLNLNETVEGLLKLMRRLIGEDIDLIWQPSAVFGLVRMDPTQINQILTNLCVNARDAIAGVGKVTIETGCALFDQADCAEHPGFVQGDYALLAVSDDGCGMDKETQVRIFEPFFTTKGIGKGTGLGLATVYGIVEQNNGFITVYSEPGKGTTFKVYLPRHEGKSTAALTESPSPPSKSRGETVLLVEDDLAILANTQKILNRLGYTVLTASTPSEAIRLAEGRVAEIHLLITDVVMPDMNGLDLSKRLLSRNPKLKCLFMSGHATDVIADHGAFNEGARFIQKPFTTKDLASKIRKMLDQ